MRRLALLTGLFVATSALAEDAAFAKEIIEATAQSKLPGLDDAAWRATKPLTLRLAEQKTIHLHDKKANALLEVPAPLELEVRALALPDAVVLRLEWGDDTFQAVDEKEGNTFADSVAVEVPERFGPGVRLPAVSMGDEGASVRLTMLRAMARGAVQSQLVAAGFGSSTRLGAPVPSEAMQWNPQSKRWTAMFTVATKQPLTPIALAVWDGARHERSGYKRLSAWKFVQRPNATPDAKYVAELSWGYGAIDAGAKERGRALAEAVCVACHHLPGKRFAAAGVAPSLEGLGAFSTPGYLRDSIVEPNQIVLHEPNPNQHYAPTATRDANGAAPNADGFRWGMVAEGKRTSKMPPFANFTAEQISDLVVFLRSLGAPP